MINIEAVAESHSSKPLVFRGAGFSFATGESGATDGKFAFGKQTALFVAHPFVLLLIVLTCKTDDQMSNRRRR